jgi:hypothetical protein
VAARRHDRKLLQMVMRNDINDGVAYESDYTRLDQGEGKNLTLNECSREQLEKEVSNTDFSSLMRAHCTALISE